MDAQQLTTLPGRTAWSLREEAVLAGADALVGATPWWSDAVAEPRRSDSDEAAAPAPGEASGSTGSRIALAVAAGAALLISVVAGVAFLAGIRWFVVETPSMGTAAPVGTLVITAPAAGGLHVGEVIAFTPPGVPRTYTHRVFSVAADGSVRTKGDINGAPDPWTIAQRSVIGHAVALIPAAGYAVRGIPPLVVGAVLVLVLTTPLRTRARRASARIIGLHVVITGVLLWLHPLVGLVMITSERAGDVVKASVVSTGLLPIRLMDTAGTVVAHLGTGVPQLVALPTLTHGASRLSAVPDLTGPLQVALVTLAALPALVVLVVGLPRDEPETS